MPAPKDPEKRAAWLAKMSANAKVQWSDTDNRQKMSEKLKGRPSPHRGKTRGTAWNKGVPMSEAQKTKLREAKTGQTHTPETRARMSATRTGKPIKRIKPSWNKGIPLPEERKQKLSKERTGLRASGETKAKMSVSQKARNVAAGGDALSPEARQKIGQAHKGVRHTPEARARMSAARQGKSSHMKGKAHTPETRAKIGQKNTAHWASLTEEQRTAKLARLQASNQHIVASKVEDIYAQSLDELGIVYDRQKSIGWYRVDFYIPAENRIIEVNGCYWHSCEQCGHANKHPKTQAADMKRYAYLRRKGYIVDIVWEHDLRRMRR